MDTYVTGESFRVASLAAGASIAAVRCSLSGESCFALVRPPGHHAEPGRAMGYCLFNNAAVAAAWALDRVERVAIIDWDLHHGNGTQKIFYESDRVLFCSIHQANIFPWSGWIDEVGAGRGKGFSLNAPSQPAGGSGTTIASSPGCSARHSSISNRMLSSSRPGRTPCTTIPRGGCSSPPKISASSVPWSGKLPRARSHSSWKGGMGRPWERRSPASSMHSSRTSHAPFRPDSGRGRARRESHASFKK